MLDAADALIARGNALEDAKQLDAALRCYQDALRIAPHYARAHMNVGNALLQLGRLADAIQATQEAVRCSPAFAAARFNLGTLLAKSRDYAAAETELREALRLRPAMAEAAVALADVFASTGRAAEAELALQQALGIRPDYPGALANLGLLYADQDRVDDAEDMLRHAKSIDPCDAAVNIALANLLLKTGRSSEAGLAFGEALEHDTTLPELRSGFLFSLNFNPDLDPVAVFDAHVQQGVEMTRTAGPPFVIWNNSPDPDRRLKVGYVSGDLGLHPTGLFLRPVLEQHDRSRFEIHCYSNREHVADVTQMLQRAAGHWNVVATIEDNELARRIRDDGIDILVDLSGHTARNRLDTFARHPAPVQVTWLGYLNTTGVPAMDYRICDRHTDPSGAAERLHTERLYRLAHSQWCYAPVYSVPLIEDPHVGHPEAVVFGSFNQYAKISEACLDLWCPILVEVREATLVVLDVPSGNTRDSFRRRVAQRGVDPDRIEIRGRQSIGEYFQQIGNVDVALDTFPYNGATTTFDTLWMGVPVVALRGERGISRSGFSIMQSLPAPELIAADADEYIRLNVRLARDAGWRRELRSTLRPRLQSSPLMDSASFVHDLEAGYREMWRDWCRKPERSRSG